MYSRVDKDGNKLSVSDEGKATLELSIEDRIRNIGVIRNGTYTKYDEEKHIFRKLNAWSINWELFQLSNKIKIVTNEREYTINTGEISPRILHFRGAGIERKVYIPLKHFNITENG